MMIKLFAFVAVLLPFSMTAETLRGHNSHWQCAAYDSENKQWLVSSSYQRKAINQAKSNCISQSQNPSSCSVAKEYCEMVVAGHRIRTRWQCLAMDQMGDHWWSDTHNQRDQAVLGARQLCQQLSAFPSSCYVRLMTCKRRS